VGRKGKVTEGSKLSCSCAAGISTPMNTPRL
jgi:hypothetical protein